MNIRILEAILLTTIWHLFVNILLTIYSMIIKHIYISNLYNKKHNIIELYQSLSILITSYVLATLHPSDPLLQDFQRRVDDLGISRVQGRPRRDAGESHPRFQKKGVKNGYIWLLYICVSPVGLHW